MERNKRFSVIVMDQYANEFEIRMRAADHDDAEGLAYSILDTEVDTWSVISVSEITENG